MHTAYDEVPYQNVPFPQALPGRHATVATLHGLAPADPRTARVLELGCYAGAHLIGVAAAYPRASAVGVDLTASAIKTAQDDVEAAGLENVRFEVADVLELTGGELGEFDYVIAHGLYGWVDAPVREAVLAACRAHLAPDGIAYVSYTVHPGGHLRVMLREMAQWHARGLSDPREVAERARGLFALLDRLGEGGGPSFYSGVVGEDVRTLATASEAALVHDLLERDYAPVWFADFAAQAGRHGLTYVGDAIVESSREPPWSDIVGEFVAENSGGDRIAYEQYLDLLVLRRFRHSLLCHADRAPAPRIQPGAVQRLLVAADADPSELPELLRGALTVALPVPFAEARERAGVPAGEFTEALVRAFDAGLVAFHTVPPPAATTPGERPRASALARSQAREGAMVTTLLSQVLRITDQPTAELLRLLDGTRDRAAILAAFDGPLDARLLDASLARFAELGLLHPED